jgi:YYY domain-containing protein
MDILINVLIWLSLGYLCQFAAYPFMLQILPRTAAYGVSKTVGIIVFGYSVWVLGLGTNLSTDLLSCLILAAFCAVSIWLTIKSHARISWIPTPEKKDILIIEGLYVLSFILFLCIYSSHPEIYWGEKPMDFSFLNYFTRLENLPPSDPWASGNTLGYYYLGTFIISLFHKLSGMPANFGFGVALSQIFALLVVTISTIFIRLGFSTKVSATLGSIAVLAADYDVLYLWLIKKQKLGFDLFWASSRTLTSPGMNEYPLWSMLFADLHAHVITLPFVAAALVLGVNFISNVINGDYYRSTEKLLWLGFIWGTLCALNTWDFLGFGIVIGLGLYLIIFDVALEDLRRAAKIVTLSIILLISALLTSIPFHLTVIGGTKASWGFVYPEEFNTIAQIFKIHGHWILLILTSFLAFATSKIIQINKGGILRAILYAITSFIPIIVGLCTKNLANVPDAPWGVLAIATLLCAIGAHSFYYFEKISIRCLGLLTVAAGLIYTLSECFYLMDRMNTTFKTYHLIWALLGIVSLAYIIESLNSIKYSITSYRFFKFASLVITIPSIIAAILCIWMMGVFERIPSERPTLNGTKYLSTFNPVEQKAFEWINLVIKGTPTIVEAFGPSYQEYSRFSMHTGLPLILGWEYHVQQRGTKDSNIRKDDVRRIYTEPDVHARMQSLNRYNTQLIIVGERERDAYGSDVDQFFANSPEYFTAIFEHTQDNKSIKVYRHKYTSINTGN